MLTNVTWTARNRREVILPRSAEKEEEFLNVVSGMMLTYLTQQCQLHITIQERQSVLS